MNVKVVSTALIVTSTITAAQMESAIHYCPDALKVTDSEGNVLYRAAKADEASLSEFGIVFNGVSTDGNLQATVIIPDVEDKKDYVAKTYGLALAQLSAAETVIVEEIEATNARVGGAISDMEII